MWLFFCGSTPGFPDASFGSPTDSSIHGGSRESGVELPTSLWTRSIDISRTKKTPNHDHQFRDVIITFSLARMPAQMMGWLASPTHKPEAQIAFLDRILRRDGF